MASTNLSKIKLLTLKNIFLSKTYLWLPFILAVFLRLNNLTQNSFWYDESFTIFLTRQPLFEMVRLISLDFHPPLWEILEWLVRRIFGESEFSYRLISLLTSLATLWILHKILQHFNWSKRDQFSVILLATILPYQVWMAQDARVYALFSFLYMLAFYYILKSNKIGFIGATGLMLYTNNAAPFYSVPLFLLFIFHFRKRWRTALIILSLILLSFCPWFFVFWGKIEGSYFLKPALNPFGAIEHLAFIFAPRSAFSGITTITSYLIFTIISVSLLVAFISFFVKSVLLKRNNQATFSSCENPNWIVISLLSLILIALASISYKNVFFYRSLSVVSLPLIVSIYSFLKKVKILGCLYAFLLLTTITIHWAYWSPMEKGGYLKEAIISNQGLTKEGDVFFHATATTLLPFSIYYPKHQQILLDEILPPGFLIEPLQQAYQIQKTPLEKIKASRIWIVWADDPELPERVHKRMDAYTHNAILRYQIIYPHASNVNVFLLEK